MPNRPAGDMLAYPLEFRTIWLKNGKDVPKPAASDPSKPIDEQREGTIPAAATVLREVRIDIPIGDVRAARPESAAIGARHELLSRLKSFEMRQDRLTLSW